MHHIFPNTLDTEVRLVDFLVSLTTIALDEMGSRIDELEQSINDLRSEMGIEGSSPSTPSKPKDEPKVGDGSF